MKQEAFTMSLLFDTYGAKYPLCDAEARRGDSLTISNEWIEPTVRLRIREGLCWLICSGPSAR